MFNNLARHITAICRAALALLALCPVQPSARAGATAINTIAAQGTHALYQDVFVPVGLAHGQTLRYSWAYILRPPPHTRLFEPASIQVKLLDADGRVIAQAEAPAVGDGRFQSFDFSRGAIRLLGEAGTGRLQVRVEATLLVIQTRTGSVPEQSILETFADAVEVIDNASGRTTVSVGSGVNELILNDSSGSDHLPPITFQIISAGNDYLAGIASGQTLRLTSLNSIQPPPGSDGRKYKMLVAVLVLDSDGNVVAQSDEVVLAPGESHSFDFSRSALNLAGGVGSGRVQVRAEIRRRPFQGFISRFPQGEVDRTPVTLEVVDDNTGKTTLLISQKPKEIVVVGSK